MNSRNSDLQMCIHNIKDAIKNVNSKSVFWNVQSVIICQLVYMFFVIRLS